MKQYLTFILLFSTYSLFGQTRNSFADSIRIQYQIPELAYAVVSSDSIYEMQVIGYQRINTTQQATSGDRFRIGSNTKAITGFIAALLVKEGKIRWNTLFFDLFPELRSTSNKAYHKLTLLNLLSFRTRLFPYTYTYAEPTQGQFSGNESEQRYLFTKWFFEHQPVADTSEYHFSNLGYTAAGLMLEKVSGKPYKELVTDLGKQLGINFGFGTPNTIDTLQPWGHNQDLIQEAPQDNFKLNWLLAAGNINLTLPDYIKFIQLQLKGLSGKSSMLTKEEFCFMHYGLPRFAVGWFWTTDTNNENYSYNIGNPGTFLSKVYVYKDTDRAYIFLTNAQTTGTDTGTDILYIELKRQYGK